MQFTASAELHEKLARLQALMRSQVPDSDLSTIIEQAVAEKLEQLEAKRYAKASYPRIQLLLRATHTRKERARYASRHPFQP